MLANTISGQLMAERHRSLLDEAAVQGMARQTRAARRGYPGSLLLHLGGRVRMGLAVRIRPIRVDDAELLKDGFARMSENSRRLRFFVSKKRLSEKEVRYLTQIDHHNHEALVAVSRLRGRGLAVARFIRDPADPDAAEVAVAVVDEWQARGLGTALTNRLAARARCEGVHRFTATVLEENDGARRLLPKIGAT